VDLVVDLLFALSASARLLVAALPTLPPFGGVPWANRARISRCQTHEETAKYLADLVICVARFAQGTVDLDAAGEARLAEKFPVVHVLTMGGGTTCADEGCEECFGH
jgi:hypothetical protein